MGQATAELYPAKISKGPEAACEWLTAVLLSRRVNSVRGTLYVAEY